MTGRQRSTEEGTYSKVGLGAIQGAHSVCGTSASAETPWGELVRKPSSTRFKTHKPPTACDAHVDAVADSWRIDLGHESWRR